VDVLLRQMPRPVVHPPAGEPRSGREFHGRES
jgi:hypothetical protein